jgi:fluoride exporter
MLGGAIGSALRYSVGLWLQPLLPGFPWATLLVNITGSFAIGIVLGLAVNSQLSQEWRLFLAVGVLGGFTTFSTFSYETLALLEQNRWEKALVYISSSVVLGLLAVWVAYRLTKLG